MSQGDEIYDRADVRILISKVGAALQTPRTIPARDRILAEVNNGGAMVEATIRALDPRVSFKAVHASRGKVVRAEPIAALYEQRKVHHVGGFAVLEDQMCAFTSDFDRARTGYSPDRVDSLVWALTELSEPVHRTIITELRI